MVGALVVVATAALGVPVASAGTYDVVSCRAPGARGRQQLVVVVGGHSERSPVRARTPRPTQLSGNCASPSGLRGRSTRAALARFGGGTFANFGFTAPTDTDTVRVTLWRYGTGAVGADDPNTPGERGGTV